ncbi:MAG: choice-of-anchor V domain-containing protein [Candidatus Kapaibacterium sp.]
MIKKILISSVVIILGVALYTNIKAFSTGIIGHTKRAGNTEGCTCHGPSPTLSVNVSIQGPDSVSYGDTVTFTVSLTGGPLVRGGTNIAAGNGKVILSQSDNSLQSLEGSPGVFELTHVIPKVPVSGSVTFTFRYVAPAAGTKDTLFATGNSVDFTGGNNNDSWNFGENKVIVLKTPTGIAGTNEIIDNFRLKQNYPNPFNPVTKINYSIAKSGNVNLSVFDSKGNMVKNLVNERMNAGEYSVDFNGNGLSSGVYYYKIDVNGLSETRKMMLVK